MVSLFHSKKLQRFGKVIGSELDRAMKANLPENSTKKEEKKKCRKKIPTGHLVPNRTNLNSLHPYMRISILHSALSTFPIVLKRGIC